MAKKHRKAGVLSQSRGARPATGWSKVVAPNCHGYWLRLGVSGGVHVHYVAPRVGGHALLIDWWNSGVMEHLWVTDGRVSGWWWFGPVPPPPCHGP